MVIWIHLHSQVMPHLWNYSILLIHCVVSSHCSQTPARKTLHPQLWGVLKGKQLPQKQQVCLLRTGLCGRIPTAISWGWLRDPSPGWLVQGGQSCPSLPVPVSQARWPSCCTAPAPNTCCLQMPKRKLGFAVPNSQALPPAAKAATP